MKLLIVSIIVVVGITTIMPSAFAEKLDQLDGTITPTGCNVIDGKIMEEQVNLLNTRVCYYDNYKFLITYNPHIGCIGSLGHWDDPENNKSFGFRSPCDEPNFESYLSKAKNIVLGFFLSPLKQLALGVAPNQVTCDGSHQLIMKTYSHVPVCVKPETAKKLVERGWGYGNWSYTSQSVPKVLESENTEMENQITDTGDFSCSGSAACFQGTINRIIDGDTLEINGTTIRLALTSTPELGTEVGNKAKEFLIINCPVGSKAVVDEDDLQTKGSYGRMLAKVYCERGMLNDQLLGNNLATIDKRFCSKSEFSGEDWAKKYGC